MQFTLVVCGNRIIFPKSFLSQAYMIIFKVNFSLLFINEIKICY